MSTVVPSPWRDPLRPEEYRVRCAGCALEWIITEHALPRVVGEIEQRSCMACDTTTMVEVVEVWEPEAHGE